MQHAFTPRPLDDVSIVRCALQSRMYNFKQLGMHAHAMYLHPCRISCREVDKSCRYAECWAHKHGDDPFVKTRFVQE